MPCVSLHREWTLHTQGRAQALVTVKPQKSKARQLHHLDHSRFLGMYMTSIWSL